MKKQINFRVAASTAAKLAELMQRTGMLQTEVITVAIDRMYREEVKPETTPIITGSNNTSRLLMTKEI